MKRIIGIDEAGYGPRLGPLVTAAALFRAPGGLAPEDLFDRLHPVVGRRAETRPLLEVDDSKRLYHFGGDLGRLERSIISFLATTPGGAPANLADLLGWSPRVTHRRLVRYPWYPEEFAREPLPRQAASHDRKGIAALVRALDQAGLCFDGLRIEVQLAGEFNADLQRSGNKAATHAAGVMRMLEEVLDRDGPREVDVVVDRLGGRAYYAPLLATTLPFTAVRTEQEDAGCSRYRIDDGVRCVRIAFMTKADSLYLPVALASMTAKYVRELFMGSLNAFFCTRVRSLRPTAGYPTDAARFLEEISELLPELDASRLIRQR